MEEIFDKSYSYTTKVSIKSSHESSVNVNIGGEMHYSICEKPVWVVEIPKVTFKSLKVVEGNQKSGKILRVKFFVF